MKLLIGESRRNGARVRLLRRKWPALLCVPILIAFVPGIDAADRNQESIIETIQDPSQPQAARASAVHSLSKNLSSSEIAGLYAFLKSVPCRPSDITSSNNHPSSIPQPAEQSTRALCFLKNEILNVLRSQNSPPPTLAETLVEICCSPSQDIVARDYAIQHLIIWYSQGAGPETKTKIRAALLDGANEKTSIAGTALLGLHRLADAERETASTNLSCTDPPVINPSFINERALELARSDCAESAVRITALQVCAERGLKEIVPLCESLLKSNVTLDRETQADPELNSSPARRFSAEQVSIPLQLSAIAAIGRLGGLEQAALISKLQFEQNDSLRNAARAALQQLERTHKLLKSRSNPT